MPGSGVFSDAVACNAGSTAVDAEASARIASTGAVPAVPEGDPSDRRGGELFPLCGEAFVICSGVFASVGGMDEGLRGWGGDDDAMSVVLERLQYWRDCSDAAFASALESRRQQGCASPQAGTAPPSDSRPMALPGDNEMASIPLRHCGTSRTMSG